MKKRELGGKMLKFVQNVPNLWFFSAKITHIISPVTEADRCSADCSCEWALATIFNLKLKSPTAS